jgi:transcriptional regulator with XRE-family HTH domain
MQGSRFDPQLLVAQRKALRMSQRALAAKAGVSQALVAELERGKHRAGAQSIAKIAAALGIEVAALSTRF